MRTLLLYPTFTLSFWHFGKALALQAKKTMMPPLSLLTFTDLLPQTGEFKLVDLTVRSVTESEVACELQFMRYLNT